MHSTARRKLLVLTELFLPMEGGSINWLLNTYSRFPPTEVVFLTGTQGLMDKERQIDSNLAFRVRRTRMDMPDWDPTIPFSLHRYLQIFIALRSVCKTDGIGQMHCAKVLPEGLVALWARYFLKVPYLLYAHGEEITSGLTSRKFQWLLPKIYNGAAAIIANSANTRELLIGIGVNAHKIHVIHPAVDSTFFGMGADSGEAGSETLFSANGPVLLTVGRMQRRKGQDMVIRAMPRVRAVYPNARYIVVGGGREKRYLKDLAAEKGVTDAVVFAGRVPDDALPRYYAACDLFIMPNRSIGPDIEGFGMVFLEANAAGKPVIGGISGGTADAIRDGVTGLRVDGSDVDAISAAILHLLDHPETAKAMGEAGRKRVREGFTWESVAARTRTLTEQIFCRH